MSTPHSSNPPAPATAEQKAAFATKWCERFATIATQAFNQPIDPALAQDRVREAEEAAAELEVEALVFEITWEDFSKDKPNFDKSDLKDIKISHTNPYSAAVAAVRFVKHAKEVLEGKKVEGGPLDGIE